VPVGRGGLPPLADGAGRPSLPRLLALLAGALAGGLLLHLTPTLLPLAVVRGMEIAAERELDPAAARRAALATSGGAFAGALAQDLAVLAGMAVDNARLYRDARAAVLARDDLLAVVSHDLGNPLSAIRIGTSLLLRTLPESEHGSGGWQHLEFIRQSVLQMENLINDLLDVKRLEAGRVTLELQDLDMCGVINDVMDVFRPIAAGRNVRLDADSPAVRPVSGDYQRLVQVLSNLVSNAIKFTEPGGCVTVTAREAPGVAVLSVSDTGAGIPVDHQQHVFDRYWQARRDGRKGLGLGLAIARGIVEAHGGRIWLESVPGEGSAFLFTVPLA
jgi:signal transduction histidine kinase